MAGRNRTSYESRRHSTVNSTRAHAYLYSFQSVFPTSWVEVLQSSRDWWPHPTVLWRWWWVVELFHNILFHISKNLNVMKLIENRNKFIENARDEVAKNLPCWSEDLQRRAEGRSPHGKSRKGMSGTGFWNYSKNLQLKRKCSVKVILLHVSCSRRQRGFVPKLVAREPKARRSGKAENKETKQKWLLIRMIVN